MARRIIIIVEDDGEPAHPDLSPPSVFPLFRETFRNRKMCATCSAELARGRTPVCGCVMPGDGPVCSVAIQDVVVGVGKVSENAGFDAVSVAPTQDVVFDGGYRTLMGVMS